MLILKLALNLRTIGNISSCERHPSPVHDNAYTIVFIGAKSQSRSIAELTNDQGNIITTSTGKATSLAQRAEFPEDEMLVSIIG